MFICLYLCSFGFSLNYDIVFQIDYVLEYGVTITHCEKSWERFRYINILFIANINNFIYFWSKFFL